MAEPKFSRVTSSHTATVALRDRMQGASKSGMFWTIAAFGIALVPFAGLGIAHLLERKKNSVVEKKKLDVLADYYRNQVAAQLGISPDSVTASDLKLAAQVNPALDQAIKKVTAEKSNANRNSAMANGAAYVAGVGMAGGVAKIGVELGAAVVGGSVSSMFDKNVLRVQDVIEHIDAKVAAGQVVTATDIVLLRISQDEQWQEAFKKQHGKPFHQLDEAAQQQVLSTMPDMLLNADKEAVALTRGLISPQSLVMSGPATSSNFAASVGGSRAAQGSYAANVEAQRALASQAAMSVN